MPASTSVLSRFRWIPLKIPSEDDFDQGLAQCLVEMQACQWMNQKIGKIIGIFGIVTNGEGWKFYKLTETNQVYETPLYSLRYLAEILGALHVIFTACEQNLIVEYDKVSA